MSKKCNKCGNNKVYDIDGLCTLCNYTKMILKSIKPNQLEKVNKK